MRILCLTNNWVGLKVLGWLKAQREDIVGLVVHPLEKQKYGHEILSTYDDPEGGHVFYGPQFQGGATLEAIRALRPDIGVSAFFGYILHPDLLDLMPAGCVNIHPALLPQNRGAYPNVWNIVEGTPAGVTVHYMDANVDRGDIIAQRVVPVDPVDTGETLYRKLEQVCVELFKEIWPLIRSGQAPRIPQQDRASSYHATRDVLTIDEIDLNRSYRAGELIDIIRARTFPPYAGAYFWHEGRKVYLRLQLLYEDHLGQ